MKKKWIAALLLGVALTMYECGNDARGGRTECFFGKQRSGKDGRFQGSRCIEGGKLCGRCKYGDLGARWHGVRGKQGGHGRG